MVFHGKFLCYTTTTATTTTATTAGFSYNRMDKSICIIRLQKMSNMEGRGLQRGQGLWVLRILGSMLGLRVSGL